MPNRLDEVLRKLWSRQVEVSYFYQKRHEAIFLRDEQEVKRVDDRLVESRDDRDRLQQEASDLRKQGFRESIFDLP